MAAIHLQRPHRLGFERARELARNWADAAGARLGVECKVVPGDGVETIEFARSGVKGALQVEAEQFTVEARLGLLLSAFSNRIETEIASSLDELIAGRGPTPAGTA